MVFAYFKVTQIVKPLINYSGHENNISSGGLHKGYSMHKKSKKIIPNKKIDSYYPNIKGENCMQGHSEKIKWGLRALLNKPFFGKLGYMCYIGKTCYIAQKKDLFFGDRVRIYPGMRTETQDGGKILLGSNVSIGQNFHAVAVQNKLEIGNNVTISGNVFVSNCDHTFNDENSLALEQPLQIRDTKISDDCFIGYGAAILAGTHLGKHCIVGANSVVRGIFPDNTLLAGSPAKVLKRFDIENKKWVRAQEI